MDNFQINSLKCYLKINKLVICSLILFEPSFYSNNDGPVVIKSTRSSQLEFQTHKFEVLNQGRDAIVSIYMRFA